MAPWEKLMIGERQSHFSICFCLKKSLFGPPPSFSFVEIDVEFIKMA
jgi:hypothetical protein